MAPRNVPCHQLVTNLLKHGKDGFLTGFEDPRIERFCDIRREVTITSAGKVDFCPMLSFRVLQQPGNRVWIDVFHVVERFIEFWLSCCTGGFPKEWSELWIFELFTEVGFEMLEAIAMRTAREYTIDSFEETFLAVGEEYKGVIDYVLECIALYDR